MFLSSPGHVLAARVIVRDFVARELHNERVFRDTKLEVVSWDDPEAPVPFDAHLTPQQAIDRELPHPSDCDVVVVILWSRMGTPLTPHLGWQWRCALALSSITSIGRNIPSRLIVALVKDGTLTPRQARNYLEVKGAVVEAVEALAAITLNNGDSPSTFTELAFASLDLAMMGHNESTRAELMARALGLLLAEGTTLPGQTRDAVLRATLGWSRSFTTYLARACAMTSIALHASDPIRTEVLREAVESATAIESAYERAKILVSLMSVMPHDKKHVVADDALRACVAIVDPDFRSQAVAMLASLA